MGHSVKEYRTVAEEVKEEIYTARLLSNGIIDIAFNPKLEIIDKVHLQALKESIGKLGKGKKMPVYFNIAPFLNISPEGQAYSVLPESQEFALANAVLVDSLAKKIAFNFFIAINKPLTPIKAFGSKEDAFEWLLKK